MGREGGIEPPSPGWSPGALPKLCYPRTVRTERVAPARFANQIQMSSWAEVKTYALRLLLIPAVADTGANALGGVQITELSPMLSNPTTQPPMCTPDSPSSPMKEYDFLRGGARVRCEVPHRLVWLESLPRTFRNRLIRSGLAFRSPVHGLPRSCRGNLNHD